MSLPSQVFTTLSTMNAAIRFTNGNVGIGTNSPGAKLEIADGSNDGKKYGSLQITQDNASIVASANNVAQISFVRGGNYVHGLGYLRNSNTFGFGHGREANVATFSPNFLAITDTGNVGIGSTSPGYLLSVNGTIGLPYGQAIHAYGNPNTRLFETAWVGQGILGDVVSIFTPGAQNSNSAMNIVGLGGTSFVHIPGNVGIGTSSPSATLHVASTNLATLLIQGDRDNTDGFDDGRLASQIQMRCDGLLSGYNLNVYNGAGGQHQFAIDHISGQTVGSTRMFIDGTGNVGIGTASPEYMLDVNTLNVAFRTGLTGGWRTQWNYSGSTGETTFFNYRGGGTGGIWFKNLNTSNQDVGWSNMICGSITSNPRTTYGAGNVNGLVLYNGQYDGNGDSTSILFDHSTGGFSQNRGSGITSICPSGTYGQVVDMYFSTGASGVYSEKMRIRGNGNVGIGTGSPQVKLDVSGDVGLGYGSAIRVGAGSNWPNGTTKLIETGWDLNSMSGDCVSIYTPGAANGTPRINIGSNGGINLNGNVGIGIASPETTLDVRGTSQFIGSGLGTITGNTTRPARFGWSNVNGSYLDILGYRTSNGSTWETASTRIQQTIDVTQQSYIEFNGTGKMYSVGMYANNGQGLTVNSAGNVGIGTASPTAVFTIVNDSDSDMIRLVGASSEPQNYSMTIRKVQNGVADGGPQFDYRFVRAQWAGFNGTQMSLAATGNVGIGTTSPSERLHVAGSFRAGDNLKIQTAGDPYSYLGSGLVTTDTGDARLNIQDRTSNCISFYAGTTKQGGITAGGGTLGINSGTLLLNSGSGNVGIGTASPAYTLDLATSIVGDVARFRNTNTAGYGTIQLQNTTRTWFVGAGAAGAPGYKDKFYILAGGGPGSDFVMTPSGNVGIGTESPRDRLSVRGNVQLQDDAIIWARSEGFYHGGSLTLAAGYVSSDTVNPETARASIVIHGFNPGDDSLSGDIQLRTSSTTRLHIERDSGNVGINTITPIGKLTVRDDTNDTGDNAGGLFVTGSDTTNKRLHMGYHATNNYGWIEAVRVGVDLQPLILQPRGGNVGIGTASPQTKLDVNGTVSMKNGTVTANRDTAYSLGNLQAKWTGTTPTQLAIALVSGTNSGGYASWVSSYNGTGITNSPTSTSFITVATASAGTAGDTIVVNVFLLSSNTFYRVTAQVGSGYTNNPIIIEKLM